MASSPMLSNKSTVAANSVELHVLSMQTQFKKRDCCTIALRNSSQAHWIRINATKRSQQRWWLPKIQSKSMLNTSRSLVPRRWQADKITSRCQWMHECFSLAIFLLVMRLEGWLEEKQAALEECSIEGRLEDCSPAGLKHSSVCDPLGCGAATSDSSHAVAHRNRCVAATCARGARDRVRERASRMTTSVDRVPQGNHRAPEGVQRPRQYQDRGRSPRPHTRPWARACATAGAASGGSCQPAGPRTSQLCI